MLMEYEGPHPPQQILLLHLSGNYLGQGTTMSLRLQASDNFVAIQQLWLGVKLLWSELLPRHIWHHACSVQSIDMAQKRVNAYLGRCMVELAGGVIWHPSIGWKDTHLF